MLEEHHLEFLFRFVVWCQLHCATSVKFIHCALCLLRDRGYRKASEVSVVSRVVRVTSVIEALSVKACPSAD